MEIGLNASDFIIHQSPSLCDLWVGLAGQKFEVDARDTEKLASRITLPESVAQQLAFRLEAENVTA
jgi:hypothetical protein